MTAERDSTMTLEEVRNALKNCWCMPSAWSVHGKAVKLADIIDAIDAHLSRKVSVSDEAVERAKRAYGLAFNVGSSDDLDSIFSIRMRAALESFSASMPVARVSDETSKSLERASAMALVLRSQLGNLIGDTCPGLVDKADRLFRELEALLAQGSAGVREGWKWVPVEPTQKMLHEAAKHDYYSEKDPTWRSLWKTMLNSTPSYGEGE